MVDTKPVGGQCIGEIICPVVYIHCVVSVSGHVVLHYVVISKPIPQI